MTLPKAYLEIEPLFEDHWTGIPNVIAAIAAGAMDDRTIDWTFTFKTIALPRSLVGRFLAARSGAGGLAQIPDLAWGDGFVPADGAARGIGVYTNIKPMRNFFGTEAQIIYDLSPLLTPQFHNHDNIFHFANRIRADIASSQHLFCISDAVRSDVHAYFGYDHADMSLIDMGMDLDASHLSAAHLPFHDATPEPYVAIIGTLEPRKNGRIMLDYLRRNPGFAERYRIVFVGRDGWLDAKQRLLAEVREAGVPDGRIVFTGYVTEAEKIALLHNAAFCVYPSFFEGYGLPVLEAGVFGKVTVSSNSSSIPEVFPESCVFFDPTSLHEFGQALERGALRAAQSRSWQRSVTDIAGRAEARSWSRCYPTIARWIHERSIG